MFIYHNKLSPMLRNNLTVYGGPVHSYTGNHKLSNAADTLQNLNVTLETKYRSSLLKYLIEFIIDNNNG